MDPFKFKLIQYDNGTFQHFILQIKDFRQMAANSIIRLVGNYKIKILKYFILTTHQIVIFQIETIIFLITHQHITLSDAGALLSLWCIINNYPNKRSFFQKPQEKPAFQRKNRFRTFFCIYFAYPIIIVFLSNISVNYEKNIKILNINLFG